MAIIHLRVVTGHEFTISDAFYGKEGPMETLNEARVQMSFLITKMATVTVDQGKMVNAAQIVYAWVED